MTVPRVLRVGLVASAFACGLVRAPAQAGPIEQLVDVALGPGAAPVVVVRYVNGGGGLIYGGRGRSWKLQCSGAFLGPNETATGPMLMLADGTLLLATSLGVVAGQLDGCNVRREFPAVARVIDLIADPTDPNAALALVSSVTSSMGTTLRRRSAAGVWSAFGVTDDRLATGVRAATHAGGLRIYETALLASQDDDAGPRYYTYKLRYSDDGAVSFHESALPVDGTPRVIGVDPSNADHVAVLVDRTNAADRILISRDRGATFMPYFQIGQYGGLAWAADGRLWIGGSADANMSEQGVWAASNIDSLPERLALADYAVTCLDYHAPSDTLYACQHFWFGEVDAHSGAYATTLSFDSVADFVSCEGANAAVSCKSQLCSAYCGPGHFASAAVCAAYDEPGCGASVARQESNSPSPAARDTPDAGTPVAVRAPARDAGNATARAKATGSCSLARARSSHGAWLALLVTLLLHAVIRRRRHPDVSLNGVAVRR